MTASRLVFLFMVLELFIVTVYICKIQFVFIFNNEKSEEGRIVSQGALRDEISEDGRKWPFGSELKGICFFLARRIKVRNFLASCLVPNIL